MTTEQLEHYHKVKRARKEQGLPVFTEQLKFDRRKGDTHPLLGTELVDTESGDEYIVDSVSNCWHDGYYTQMAIREKGTKSHALIFWQNISSENESIIKGVQESRNKYRKKE